MNRRYFDPQVVDAFLKVHEEASALAWSDVLPATHPGQPPPSWDVFVWRESGNREAGPPLSLERGGFRRES